MLLIVSRFTPSICSKLLRIIRQDGHYSFSGGMNTPHQEARANFFIVQTCNCNYVRSSAFVKTTITVLFYTAYNYQWVMQLWKMANCNAVAGSVAMLQQLCISKWCHCRRWAIAVQTNLLFYFAPFPWTGNVKAQGLTDNCQKKFVKNKSLLHYDLIVCMLKPVNQHGCHMYMLIIQFNYVLASFVMHPHPSFAKALLKLNEWYLLAQSPFWQKGK